MATTRKTLESIAGNLEESMGVRPIDLKPKLSPVASSRDAGRRPLRNVGRIDINMIIPDPDQPRIEFSEDAIERLAKSIREKGQLAPIRARWSDDVGKWVIISGERRFLATKQAGLPTIDCYFQDEPLTKSEILEQQLIENLLREDLKPMEEARAFHTLMELNGWSGKELAEAIRVPQAKVTRTLALLKLPEDIQESVEAGDVSVRSAYEISRLPDAYSQRALAKKAAAGALSHDDAARAVRQRKGKPKQKTRATKLSFLTEGGWKVVVSANRKGTYPEVEEALTQALEEVRERIKNGVKIF